MRALPVVLPWPVLLALPLVLALLALLAGCAPRPVAQGCAAGDGRPMRLVELFFGRAMQGNRLVTAPDWDRFVDQVVAPNLPDGFTVFDATGAWLDRAGRQTRREPTKVLLAAIPPGRDAAIHRIRDAYQQRFHQQLVGMTVQSACADF